MKNRMPCSMYLGVIAVLVLSMAVQASEMLFISIDPADRLMNSRILGEFNSGTEGWTGSGVSGLAASGGCLTGTGTSTSPSVKLTNFTTIDLDFGFNDYLQIRMQIPIGFSGDIVFNYGTSVNSGFSSARTFSIPAGSLIADGNMHTYRLDLGMEVWWRDFLKDLQILPFGNAGLGLTFCIDYIEVGDLPGDIYLLNADLNVNTAAGETLAQCNNLQSKHAALWWSNTTWTLDGKVPGDTAWFGDAEKRRAIRMVEECYQVYTKLLGYVCPLSGALNSIATLFSYDLYKRWKPQTPDRRLIFIGQFATAIAMAVAVVCTRYVEKFPTLYQGANAVICYLAPPITTVFALGVFWKKASSRAALSTLVSGSLMGLMVFLLDINRDYTGWKIPFMYSAFYLLVLCMINMVILSLIYPHEHTAQSIKLVWKNPIESLHFQGWSGLGNYKLLAALLFAVMIFLYIVFANESTLRFFHLIK